LPGLLIGAISGARAGQDRAHDHVRDAAGFRHRPVTVTFTPTTVGSKTASLTVTATGATSRTAQLSGFGGASTTSHQRGNFGNQPLNSSSAAQTVTVRNNGTLQMTVGALSISGATSGAGFSAVAGASNGCTLNLVLNPSDVCAVSLTFTPTTSGAKTGTLAVAGGTATQAAQLSGVGGGASRSRRRAGVPQI
jgi:hypothetical protein